MGRCITIKRTPDKLLLTNWHIYSGEFFFKCKTMNELKFHFRPLFLFKLDS